MGIDASVSIVAKTATAAEAMSTAVFVLGREKATELVKRMDEIIEMKIIDEENMN